MIRYLAQIKGPLFLAIAIAVVFIFLPISLRASLGWVPLQVANLLLNGAVVFWAGWLMAAGTNRTVLASSLSGPAVFALSGIVGAIHRLVTIPPDMEVPDGIFLGNPYLGVLYVVVVGYCATFPVTMGVAALGAYLAKKHGSRASVTQPMGTPNK